MEMSTNTNHKTNLDENNQGCAISFEVNTILLYQCSLLLPTVGFGVIIFTITLKLKFDPYIYVLTFINYNIKNI